MNGSEISARGRLGPSPTSVVAGTGLILLAVIPLVSHTAGVLPVLFPLAATLAAAALFRSSPLAYLALVWWLWILTPELRRLVEFQTGWDPNDPITLAPYLATAVSLVTILRRIRALSGRFLSPFVFVIAGLLFGFLVGVASGALLPSTYGLLNWALPPILAAHVALTWRHREGYRRLILRLSALTSVVIGGYGIIQFFVLPAWDRFWMVNAPLASIGTPFPEKVRVFSTLNSPGTFGAVMVVLILLCVQQRTYLTPIAVVVGTIGLELSLVRSAWLGLVVGVAYLLLARRRGAAQARIVAVVALIVVGVMAVSGPINTIVGNRLQTIGNFSHDQSVNARVSLYQQTGGTILSDPIGKGLGSTGTATKLDSSGSTVAGIDSGFVDIANSLGWLGTGLYLGGAVVLAWRSLRRPPHRSAAVVAAAIAVAGLAELLFGNVLIGPTGVFIWLPLGLAIAYKLAHGQRSPRDEVPSLEPVARIA